VEEYVAAVCEEGHIVRRDIEVIYLQAVGKFCQRCGAPVCIKCQNCEQELDPLGTEQRPPAFCKRCGKPFPWTTRDQVVDSLTHMLTHATLPEADRHALQEEIKELREAPTDRTTEQRQVKALESLRSRAPALYNAVEPIVVTVITAWMATVLGPPPD
jgi:hypothetical protein